MLIQQHMKNIQESTRNMSNFSKNWKISKFLVYLAMVFGLFLTVERGLNTAMMLQLLPMVNHGRHPQSSPGDILTVPTLMLIT